MNVYSRLNKETNEYYVYIAMVGFSAYIPREEFEACQTNKSKLICLVNHSDSDFYIREKDEVDPNKYKKLDIYLGKETPETALEFLGYIRGLSVYPLGMYKYLTVDYSGKTAVHKTYPEWQDDYWYSEESEYIGYLPTEMIWDDIEEESYMEYVTENVFVTEVDK